MRPQRVELYEINENEFGELLIAVPELSGEMCETSFEMIGPDLVLYYGDGDVVRLPRIPGDMPAKLAAKTSITLLEVDGDRQPVRCYCGKAA